jgi:hypothetical protein
VTTSRFYLTAGSSPSWPCSSPSRPGQFGAHVRRRAPRRLRFCYFSAALLQDEFIRRPVWAPVQRRRRLRATNQQRARYCQYWKPSHQPDGVQSSFRCRRGVPARRRPYGGPFEAIRPMSGLCPMPSRLTLTEPPLAVTLRPGCRTARAPTVPPPPCASMSRPGMRRRHGPRREVAPRLEARWHGC